MAKTPNSRATAESAPAPKLTRRERGKEEKLERIRAVAHRLFSSQGFANTTTKQIAAEADIGTGTLFLYAPTKEDLLVLIFQDEVGRAIDAAFASIPAKPLLDQIIHVFDAIIAHHAADPTLARVFVKELPFVDDSRDGVVHFMAALITRLAALIDRAKERGEIASDVPAKLLAQNLFGIYFQYLQMWLSGRLPVLAQEDGTLRPALDLQLRGIRTNDAPHRPQGS
jgi:TetR/AcrR family transcriptional regulator, cholesterol catabolism regulator